MNREKIFCENCRNDVSYTVKKVSLVHTLKGEQYCYEGQAAYCSECGSEIYAAEVNDYNLQALYEKYREKNGIISLKEIREIPVKYAIGKRPLSLLLSWGEQTFSRYYEGDIPTRQYSEILRKIHDDPHYYKELLEKNGSGLLSDVCYRKSRKAVDALLTEPYRNKTKIDLVINYLLNQCEDITPLALQKALYYIQGFYYAFYRTFIFEEDCEAWAHGPVYRDVYFRYRDYRFDSIEKLEEVDTSAFSASENSILESVAQNLCCYSGKTLEGFTHKELPWKETRGDLPMGTGCDRIISKELIGGYFSGIRERYHMDSPEDIQVYAREMFGV